MLNKLRKTPGLESSGLYVFLQQNPQILKVVESYMEKLGIVKIKGKNKGELHPLKTNFCKVIRKSAALLTGERVNLSLNGFFNDAMGTVLFDEQYYELVYTKLIRNDQGEAIGEERVIKAMHINTILTPYLRFKEAMNVYQDEEIRDCCKLLVNLLGAIGREYFKPIWRGSKAFVGKFSEAKYQYRMIDYTKIFTEHDAVGALKEWGDKYYSRIDYENLRK